MRFYRCFHVFTHLFPYIHFFSETLIVPPTVATPVDTRRKIVPYNDLDSLAFEDSFI